MALRYDFRKLRTRAHLVATLGVSEALFDHALAFAPKPDPPPDPRPADPTALVMLEPMVVEFPAFIPHKIPKKNPARGHRLAWEPLFLKNEYKALARWLSQFLEHQLAGFPHPAAHGYVGGRNIRDNAAQHRGRRHLLSLDLEAFFPSISQARIETLFLETGMTPEVAQLLSRFVTIAGALPLGLPTSPVLSNAVFLPADIALQGLADAQGAIYTRYSDDLSFSAETPPAAEAVAEIVAAHGFRLARDKTRRSQRGQAHFVTGLSISDPIQPHVPRAKKHRLRQELYYARKYGLDDHLVRCGVNDADLRQQAVNRIDGLVKYVAYHEPRLSGRIKPAWSDILRAAEARPSYAPKHQNRRPFCISIDEAEFAAPAGKVLALGLSVSQNQDRLNAAAREVLEESLGDLHADGDHAAILKRGLHFADASEDLRGAFVRRLQALPFEGYAALARLERPDAYEDTYLRLLGAVIRRRLMAAESRMALFIIEQNDKVSQERIRSLVFAAQAELRAENNRRPRAVRIAFVTKPHASVSVPDFLLGLLGRYLRSQDTPAGRPEPRDRNQFERVRDKYRLILDVDNGTEYSRRRPIAPW